MIDPIVVDGSAEVWFTLPGSLTRHGYIRTCLKSTTQGIKRYVVVDDYGVLYVADERYIERPTSRAILSAEDHISSVITTMAQQANASDASGMSASWISECIRNLQHALYELAKPEATDRSV